MSKTIKAMSLLLMLILVFTACQASSDETVPEYYSGTYDGTDLDGLEICWGWDGFAGLSARVGESVLGFVPDTANADMALKRIKDVEKELNCSITVNYSANTLGELRNGVITGTQPYDLVTGNSYWMVSDIRAGYYQGLSTLLDINDFEKYGTPNMLQSALWKNDLYGVIPFAWPDLVYISSGYVIAVNEDIVTALSQPDPRDFVENNAWNWDQFEECLSAYTYKDGDRQVYGIKSHEQYYIVNMMLSNGVTFSAYENGQVVAGAYTDAGFVALDRAKNILQVTHKDCFHPSKTALDPIELYRGECVMYVAMTMELWSNSSYIMYQMDNVGILPFPQGPDATPGKYMTYHQGLFNTTGVPCDAKDAEASAKVISAMYEPFEGFETKDDIIDFMADQIFFDRRDAEIVANCTRNTEYGFFLEGACALLENIEVSNAPLSQILERGEKAYDQIVEKYMLPHFEGRIAVYGE